MKIPFIPEAAPFNDDQRAWLSGFLAGLHSRAGLNEAGGVPAADSQSAQQAAELNILFGTQTGNAEAVAEEAAELAQSQGLSPKVRSMDDVAMDDLAAMNLCLVVISTYGEGEMPDNAQLFWDALTADGAPRLEAMKFGVLALGDTSYDDFCHAGKLIDTRFEQLGATRLIARVDCDVDYDDPANAWLEEAMPLAKEQAGGVAIVADGGAEGAPQSTAKKSKWGRKNPYSSKVVENRLLSGAASKKEIRHFAFDLGDSGMTYEAGDALGVFPTNDQKLVDAMIEQLGASPEAAIAKYDAPLMEVLQQKLEIMTPPKELINQVAARSGDGELSNILGNADKEALSHYLWGKDTLDLLRLSDKQMFTIDEFVGLLKPLQHRAYSISSSPKAHEGEVHLTVAAVRWMYEKREHKGVCSTFLADRVAQGDLTPIFMSPNKAFRVPENSDAPMIMVGPGTGIAPFRAFLEERQECGAKGKNWLFFGDQHRAEDFIYEDEISQFSSDGVLSRLDLAFSRDQSEKVYVQSRMQENGKELFTWLEEGGYFYVCGDATRMARDVDDMLHSVVATHGGLSDDGAIEYVSKLKREKRYLRDVY